jgi:hypothetical protein
MSDFDTMALGLFALAGPAAIGIAQGELWLVLANAFTAPLGILLLALPAFDPQRGESA